MDFALDQTTGDLTTQNNSLFFVDGLDAVVQEIVIKFQFFLGEFFLDTTLGMPWFQDILIKAPSFAVVQEICKNCILQTPGVVSLNSFNLDLNAGGRSASLSFQATATNGVINFTQQIELPNIMLS